MTDFCIIEGISSVSAVINNTLKGLSNSPRRIKELYFDASKLKKYDRGMHARYRFLKENATACGYDFLELSDTELNKIFSGNTHGGIGAKCECPKIENLSQSHIKSDEFYCYVDGVDDPYNLGYIIRTLYPFGCCGIILPESNKLIGAPATVIKSSAGVTEMIDIFTASPESFCGIMRSNSYRITCAAIRDSVSLSEANLSAPIALVVGGEKRGISRKILDNSDQNIRINYAIEYNGSLPAVCALSAIAYEISEFKSKLGN